VGKNSGYLALVGKGARKKIPMETEEDAVESKPFLAYRQQL
jgi:hypothetical protein